jgi:hypothetical protein
MATSMIIGERLETSGDSPVDMVVERDGKLAFSIWYRAVKMASRNCSASSKYYRTQTLRQDSRRPSGKTESSKQRVRLLSKD